jgi:hypothetical protein
MHGEAFHSGFDNREYIHRAKSDGVYSKSLIIEVIEDKLTRADETQLAPILK